MFTLVLLLIYIAYECDSHLYVHKGRYISMLFQQLFAPLYYNAVPIPLHITFNLSSKMSTNSDAVSAKFLVFQCILEFSFKSVAAKLSYLKHC